MGRQNSKFKIKVNRYKIILQREQSSFHYFVDVAVSESENNKKLFTEVEVNSGGYLQSRETAR